ncbi:hypothetical protein WA158_002241 [Blastocystis sp. Blastoise]
MGEVITVQFGNKANWVGANYWNLQDVQLQKYLGESDSTNINNNILVSEVSSGIYYPRAISFEEKGCYGSVNTTTGAIQILKEENEKEDSWNGMTKVIKIQQNYQHWSDIFFSSYNPRSIYEIYPYTSINPLQSYLQGKTLISDTQFDIYFEGMRQELERCDSVSCIQVLIDTDGGWGGFVEKYLEETRGEIGKCSMITMGIYDSQGVYSYELRKESSMDDLIMNRYMSLYQMSLSSDICIPIDLSCTPSCYMSPLYDPLYTSTFLSSLILNNLTIPYRYGSNKHTLHDWTRVMQYNQYKKFIDVSLSIPPYYYNEEKPYTIPFSTYNQIQNPHRSSSSIPVFTTYAIPSILSNSMSSILYGRNKLDILHYISTRVSDTIKDEMEYISEAEEFITNFKEEYQFS